TGRGAASGRRAAWRGMAAATSARPTSTAATNIHEPSAMAWTASTAAKDAASKARFCRTRPHAMRAQRRPVRWLVDSVVVKSVVLLVGVGSRPARHLRDSAGPPSGDPIAWFANRKECSMPEDTNAPPAPTEPLELAIAGTERSFDIDDPELP